MSEDESESRIRYHGPADRPAPAGHYSPAAAFGDFIFVSGQLPELAQGAGTFEAQVLSAMERLFSALKSAGGGPEDIIKVTAYIVGVQHWSAFNHVYAGIMGDNRPARAVIPVPELHHGCLVEIEAVAVRPDGGRARK